jgi:redox-sensitive bicupin YhaK (pirin superfamily)
VSNFEASREVSCGGVAGPGPQPAFELLEPRGVPLGPHQVVQRVLPNKNRRMIGAWCFVDHYGPEDVAAGERMWVPPHPHSGLQTVSWLVSGEIRHRDSLGNDVEVRAGQLNLMTAGPAIAHSEETPSGSTEPLHGVQLWVALPSPARL